MQIDSPPTVTENDVVVVTTHHPCRILPAIYKRTQARATQTQTQTQTLNLSIKLLWFTKKFEKL